MGAFVHDVLEPAFTGGNTSSSTAVDLSELDAAVDDWIRLQVTEDGGGTTITASGGGITTWTEKTSQQSNSGARMAVFIGKVTALPLSTVTVSGATDDRIVLTCCIRDADTTDPVTISSQTNQTSNTTTLTCPSVDTTSYGQSDVLIIHSFGFDAAGESRPVDPYNGQIDILKKNDSDGAIEAQCVKKVQRSAGSTGTFIWERNISNGGTLFTEAWEGDGTTTNTEHSFSGGITWIEAFGPDFSGSFVDIQGLISTYRSQTVNTLTTIGTSDVSSDAQDYGEVTQVLMTPTAASNVWIGGYYTFSATTDLDGEYVLLYLANRTGGWTDTGPDIVFFDTSGNWESFTLATEAETTDSFQHPYVADFSAETPVASSGTINWTLINRMGVLQRKTTTSTGNRAFLFSDFGILSTAVFVGGGPDHPHTPRSIANALRSGGVSGRTVTIGTGQQTSGHDIQIGDGTIETHFSGAPQAFEWPANTQANFFYNMPVNSQDLIFYTSADDSISLDSFTIASDQEQNYTWNQSSSSSATVSTSAHTIKNVDIELLAGITYNGAAIIGCPEINAHGAAIQNCTITETTSTTNVITFDANSSIVDTTLDVVDGDYHIELGTAVTAFTITDCTFNGTPDVDKIHVLRTTGTVTITTTGSGIVAGDITSEGATVVLVGTTVTVEVICKDASDSTNISGARVLLTADSGGPENYQESVTITRSGSTATVTHTAHDLSNGDKVFIEGADQSEYLGVKTISNVSTNAYDFTVSGTPTTPATGTITSTTVLLDGTTNGSGVISDAAYEYTSDQPVTGRARKGTSSPLYQTSVIAGTITSAGFSSTTFMISDE